MAGNPFATYEDHENKLGKKMRLYSVLSPSGSVKNEGKKEDWDGIFHPDYYKAIRLRLNNLMTQSANTSDSSARRISVLLWGERSGLSVELESLRR